MHYLINFIPVILNVLLLPLWYMESTYGFWTYGRTSFFELIFNSVLSPIYLLILNIHLIKKRRRGILFHLLLMTISILCSAVIHYLNWGITSGNFFNPDEMTIGLVLFIEILFPLALVIVGMGIYVIFKKGK